MNATTSATTSGTLLGGKVAYTQPATGFRSGIEPVLLAAAVPARMGERVLEAGTGAGAALLCLGARVGGLHGIGIEQDDGLAALAAANFAANKQAGLRAVYADITAAPGFGPVDHGFANPPWHDEASSASPMPRRVAAKQADAGLPARWANAFAGAIRAGGSLTLVLPAAIMPAWLDALAGCGFGAPILLPLWPPAPRPAKLCLLQMRRARAGGLVLLPGLALHRPEGGYSDAANLILRDGAAIEGLGTGSGAAAKAGGL